MKIRLVDKAIHNVIRAEVVNGRAEIDFNDKSAEDVQEIFSVPGNMQNIELLTDAGEKFGDLQGWTVYGGTMLNGDIKTAILTKAINVTEERLTSAEAKATQAEVRAVDAETKAAALQEELTQTQLALCEVFEMLGGAA